MKKLGRSRGAVHPSPPTISDHLAFLPAYLLTLTASLSPSDLEVLAYLISANNTDSTATPPSKKGPRKNPSLAAKSGGNSRAAGSCPVFGGGGGKGGDGDHDPNFCCECFRCYMSYWVRWGASPNRQLIDEIIDAYEAELARDRNGSNNGRGGRGRKERRKARGSEVAAPVAESSAGIGGGEKGSRDTEIGESDRDDGRNEVVSGGGGDEADKGSVRSLVSFIGERIWGVWN